MVEGKANKLDRITTRSSRQLGWVMEEECLNNREAKPCPILLFILLMGKRGCSYPISEKFAFATTSPAQRGKKTEVIS